jgi:hypothetical protein
MFWLEDVLEHWIILEPIKVSAKGSSGGGEKIGPLSARHGIAEISGLYRECHDPVPWNVAIETEPGKNKPQPTVFTGGLGRLSLGYNKT